MLEALDRPTGDSSVWRWTLSPHHLHDQTLNGVGENLVYGKLNTPLSNVSRLLGCELAPGRKSYTLFTSSPLFFHAVPAT
jgi:hypothetical protein